MRARHWWGIGILGLLLAPVALLGAEAKAAADRNYVQPSEAPVIAGDFGTPGQPPLALVILGDSTGAGLGATTVGDSVGGRLAQALAATGRRVHLVGLAVSGARVAGLAPQVRGLGAGRADGSAGGPLVAVVLVGANDATHLTALSAVRAELGGQLRDVRGLGAQVVLATCPDLGAARNFSAPLRALAGWRGRGVARAEKAAAAGIPGVRVVDLAALTGPRFRADPALFSRDLFHPSPAGYAVWAAALKPATLDAAAAAR